MASCARPVGGESKNTEKLKKTLKSVRRRLEAQAPRVPAPKKTHKKKKTFS